MRRMLLLTAAVFTVLVAAPTALADTYPGGAEGCVATASGTKTCELKKATRDGGYAANGSWKVTIVRAGVTVVLTDKDSKSGVCSTAIKKGDAVKAESTSGWIAIGNPFPNGTPSVGGGKAGDYKACHK
jgi:hypothetical protein